MYKAPAASWWKRYCKGNVVLILLHPFQALCEFAHPIRSAQMTHPSFRKFRATCARDSWATPNSLLDAITVSYGWVMLRSNPRVVNSNSSCAMTSSGPPSNHPLCQDALESHQPQTAAVTLSMDKARTDTVRRTYATLLLPPPA